MEETKQNKYKKTEYSLYDDKSVNNLVGISLISWGEGGPGAALHLRLQELHPNGAPAIMSMLQSMERNISPT